MDLPQEFNLRSLRTFVVAADAGNMTRAAASLGVTQSSVSGTVAALETALGARLFDRHVRPLRLTATGARLYQKAIALLQAASDTFIAARAGHASGLPSLTLAMIQSTADLLGPALVSRLGHVAARWRVWSGISPETHAALLNHAADIIVTGSEELDDAEGLERFVLLQENFLLLAPRAWGAGAADLAALAERPFIRFSQRSTIGQQIERQISRMRLKLPFHAEFDSIAGVQAMVAEGLGWTFSTPLCLLNDSASAGRLTATPLRGAQFSRRLTLVGRRGMAGVAPALVAAEARLLLRALFAGPRAAPWPWLEAEVQHLE
jgi:DNA-binding transcriptional LysR family regulator